MNYNKKKILTIALISTMISTISLPAYAVDSYTVKSGDVLWKIAEKYGTTYQELAEINKLPDPNKIVEGQKLIVSAVPAVPAAAVPAVPAAAVPAVPEKGAETLSTAPGAMDTPEIKVELQKAIELAGDDASLKVSQLQQCKMLANLPIVHLEPGSEEHAEPTKLFDNLYYVGGTEVGVFIFTTTDGYIMIDSGYEYMPEDYILPGMKALGLDASKVKYILITHLGPDHTGGIKYFQEKYGTKIIKSMDEIEGNTVTLGDTTITVVETPRIVNGGGLSFIAPVFDNGEPHMWATYGNTNIVGSLEDKKVYRKSVANFLSYVDELKVDVVISDHPFVDGSMPKMEALRNRQEGEPNPFVYNLERARRFFEILDQSAVVATLRQEAGLDETGSKLVDREAPVTGTPSGFPGGHPTLPQ